MSRFAAKSFHLAATVGWVVCAAHAVVLFDRAEQPGFAANPLLWLALSVLLAGPALRGRSLLEVLLRPAVPPTAIRRGALLIAIGLAVLSALLYLAGLNWRFVIPGWIASQVLFIGALLPPGRPRMQFGKRAITEAIALVGLLVVAAANRLWHNGTIPFEFHGDLASNGTQAREILAGQIADFFGAGYGTIPIFGFLPHAISLAVFGDSIAGGNVMSVVAVLFTLPAVLLIGSELFGPRTGWFATLLAAGDIFLQGWARVTNWIDPVPVGAWCIYFLLRGIKRGESWSYGVSGLLAGFAANMYFAGRIIAPLCIAALVIVGIAAPRKILSHKLGVILVLAGFFVALGPSVIFNVRHYDVFVSRARAVSLSNPDVLLHTARKYDLAETDRAGILREQLRRSALSFWRYGDTSQQALIRRHHLDAIGGVLLMLGLGYAAWHWRHPSLLFLLVWVSSYIVSNTLSVDPPGSHKSIGIALPVALLGGLALDRALSWFGSGRWAIVAFGLGALLTIVSGVENWRQYLAGATDPSAVTPITMIGRFLMEQPSEYQVRMITSDIDWDRREFKFFQPHRTAENVSANDLRTGRARWPDEPTIFVLTPDAFALEGDLQQRYPAGRVQDITPRPRTGSVHVFFTR